MAASGNGSSIFSKVRGYTFFIKKLNFIHQGFLPQFKTSFVPEIPFVEHILLENVCQWSNIENLKTTFHFLKENKKRKSVIRTFRVCYFRQHVFPLRSIEALNWSNADVSKKQKTFR